MANESSVYWASPYEQPALPNT
ncbi:MAG: hypothetical protein Lokiarch_35050, partial [Candidatus Lokiarchaeum sp. GC14_75]